MGLQKAHTEMVSWETFALFWVMVSQVDSIITQCRLPRGQPQLCTILGNNAWLLRAKVVQCNSMEVRLMQGCLVNRSLEKHLSV